MNKLDKIISESINRAFKNLQINELRAKDDSERQAYGLKNTKDKWVGKSVGCKGNKHTEYDYYEYQHGTTPHKEMPDFQPKLKPLILYKQFKLRLDKDGNNLSKGMVFPLYVQTENEGGMGLPQGLKLGKWYKSGEGECWLNTENNRLYTVGKGYDTDGNKIDNLAYRPGWHMTTTPCGNQRGDGKVKGGKPGTGNNYQYTRNSEVWGKVEVCIDINATEKARSMSTTPADQCLQKLGDNEYYEYRTNSNATKDQTWYIVDKIRIIEILDDDTVDKTNNDFYNKLSQESGRKIDSDPKNYVSKTSKDIPYWKMPRTNERRYSKDDLKNMGYEPQDVSHGDWEVNNKSKQENSFTSKVNEMNERLNPVVYDVRSKKLKNIFITESQAKLLEEESWMIDTDKVLLVKRYLDKGFKRGTMDGLGSDGYPSSTPIVLMINHNGESVKKMTAEQLFYLLQDRFSKIYGNKEKRDKFLKIVMIDWYNKKISNQGLISKNSY